MKKSLIILFISLYVLVGFVSTWHAIGFFTITNPLWLGVILALTFEVGQAGVLFSLLTSIKQKVMPWVLMTVLTSVQVIGNIYASYKYMLLNSTADIQYFTQSVLFFVSNPNPMYNQVLLSYIAGAILPIVALCMTGMVVNMMNVGGKEEKSVETPEISEEEKINI